MTEEETLAWEIEEIRKEIEVDWAKKKCTFLDSLWPPIQAGD